MVNIWRNLWMGVFCGNLVNKLGWKCVGQYQRWHSLIHICNQFKLIGNSNAYFRRFCISYWGPFRCSCTQSLLVIWLSNLLTLVYWMKVIQSFDISVLDEGYSRNMCELSWISTYFIWIIEFMMMAIKDMKVIVREHAYLPYYYNRLLEAYIWLLHRRRRRYYIWRRSSYRRNPPNQCEVHNLFAMWVYLF